MSRTADLKRRIHTLRDMESILGAMKSLAVIEMNKVGKVITHLQKMQETIANAFTDFEMHYGVREEENRYKTLCLLIGSERGFCGAFNERIIDSILNTTNERNAKVIVVGRKLASKLEGKLPIDLAVSGPSTAEEIPAVISKLAADLLPYVEYRWKFIHNDGSGPLSSFPLERSHHPQSRVPESVPILYTDPVLFRSLLLEQHLYSVLNASLYVSFYAENRERLKHMEGALHHLEEEGRDLLRKLNSFRQEDITEELEILTMNFTGEFPNKP